MFGVVMAKTRAWAPPEHPEVQLIDPFSLSEEARGSDVVRASEPMPVHAWVQFPTFLHRVKGFATAWTTDAVLVEWGWQGRKQEAWIWRSGVRHRELRGRDRAANR